mgnify:CR=1 FL=1
MNTELIIGGCVAVILIALTMWLMGFKNWLVWAVAEAEAMLGSKTGQLKLRYVYDLAVVRFPIMSKLLPFGMFSKLVDAALDVMNDMITNNSSIAEAIMNQIGVDEE